MLRWRFVAVMLHLTLSPLYLIELMLVPKEVDSLLATSVVDILRSARVIVMSPSRVMRGFNKTDLWCLSLSRVWTSITDETEYHSIVI